MHRIKTPLASNPTTAGVIMSASCNSPTAHLEAVDAAQEADRSLAGALFGHVYNILLVGVFCLQDAVITAQQQLAQSLCVPCRWTVAGLLGEPGT